MISNYCGICKISKIKNSRKKEYWKTSFSKLFFSDFNTGQVSHLNHSTIKMNVSSHKFRFAPFFIPGKSFESGSPRKFIPAKFFIRRHPRKFIPAKCKYFAVFLNRESFFPQKFFPLKYLPFKNNLKETFKQLLVSQKSYFLHNHMVVWNQPDVSL